MTKINFRNLASSIFNESINSREYDETLNNAQLMIMSAEQNAWETDGITVDTPECDEMALASLQSLLCDCCDDKLQSFFIARGVRF